jgi:endonuclease-3
MKRSSARLIAKQSPHNASVVLPESEGQNAGESSRNSTKRIKLEHQQNEMQLLTEDDYSDTKNVEFIAEDPNFETDKEEAKTAKGKRRATASSSPKKVKQIPQSLAKPHPAPARWKEQYDAIERMRSRIIAPVDTMGCDQAQWKEVDPRVSFQLMNVGYQS